MNKPLNMPSNKPPLVTRFFCVLLIKVYGPWAGDNILGDMLEEFDKRKQTSAFAARLWIASQYTRTLCTGLWRQCTTSVGISRIVMLATLLVLPLLVGLVAWLSNMDTTTTQLWEMVLAGEMHRILFVAEYWQDLPYALSQVSDVDMFINPKSALWACAAMAAVNWIRSKTTTPLSLCCALALVLMVAPYIISLVYLQTAQPVPKQIGPIIAFSLFTIFYMLPMMAYWLHRQAKQEMNERHKVEESQVTDDERFFCE